MTIQISVLDNFWSILIFIFLGGAPLRASLKNVKNLRIWKVTPVTSYNTQFLLKNLFVLSKIGCLQKNRAQYLHFWPSYSNFKFERKVLFSSKRWSDSPYLKGIRKFSKLKLLKKEKEDTTKHYWPALVYIIVLNQGIVWPYLAITQLST